MESQQHRTQRNYTCCQCSNTYTGKKYMDPAKRYCGSACKQQAHRAKVATRDKVKRSSRIEEQLTRWRKSGWGGYVIREIRKAGTVMVMMHHTTASLFELHDFHNRFYRCYGWNEDEGKSVYHRCHIQPRKGRDGSIGALHPANLFIGLAECNQNYSNKAVPADTGLSIPASKLDSKWQVTRDHADEQVADMVRAFLGKEFTNYLLESKAIVMDKHHQTARRIYNRQQKGTAVRQLTHRYTLHQLEALSTEELERMDAYQLGKESVSCFRPEQYIRAALCVYADELKRMAEVSASQRQRENCRFMLGLVQVLGMYVAQLEDQRALEHHQFLPLRLIEWKPFTYMNWQQPWGKPVQSRIDDDREFLIGNLTRHCFDALQGVDVPKELLRSRLHKRLDATTLAPSVLVPTDQGYKEHGGWKEYIDALHAEAEPVWQSLLALNFCTTEQVDAARASIIGSLTAAVDRGRLEYHNQSRFQRFYKGKHYSDWGFKGYPPYLEFPPVAFESALPLAA